MFLPQIQIKTGKRALIFFTLPEWRFAEKNILLERKTSFLNINIKYNNEGLILGPVMGAGILGVILEILNRLKIEEIIAIGWAGKLNDKLQIGDIFFPRKAYSLEGVSKFYFRKRIFSPDKNLEKRIKKEFKKRKIKIKEGAILSVDAPFVFEREKALREKWENKADALDMETSALFSVSHSLQIKAIALHFIIDEIGKVITERPENKLKEKRKKLIELLKDYLEYKI